MAEDASTTSLRVGRLTKAHGLKGALKLELYTDDPDKRFAPGSRYRLQVPEDSPWSGRELELAELRWYNGHPVAFFAGVADRTAAETLARAILWVDVEEEVEPDAWYDHQLVGLDVVREGVSVGRVARVDHLPAQDLLAIATADGEVLVPLVAAIVPEVDLDHGRIVVTPPVGLFEAVLDDGDGPATPSPDGEGDASADGDEGDASADGDGGGAAR